MLEQPGLFTDCSHPRTTIVPEKRGPHYARKVCNDCKKFLGWIPSPESVKRRAENFKILTDLAKIENLTEWERQFVRDVATHKHISPKQQALLLELQHRYARPPS